MSSSESSEVHGSGEQNHKMGDSGLVWCPEIEENAPCIYFGDTPGSSPKCPGCYAARLHSVRASNWSGKQVTEAKGIIRLGTWREILPEDYAAFCAGRGVRVDGTPWERPDFKTRSHFVITRGLLDWSLYERMNANPHLLNLQVSVDIIKTEQGIQQWPSDERLQEFARLGKTMFRFKTLAAPAKWAGVVYERNVDEFQALQKRIGIESYRVLETPLRLGKNRSYQTETPLEASGVSSKEFLRCNSECGSCGSNKDGQAENRVMVCAATEKVLAMLAKIGNTKPLRVEPVKYGRVAWKAVTLEAWRKLGGTAELKTLYAKVASMSAPARSNPYYKAKVRAIVQACGVRVDRGVWRMVPEKSSTQKGGNASSTVRAGARVLPVAVLHEASTEVH